jgi:hypothetical protein
MSEFKTWEQMSELEQAQATWWDLYKDVYGVRPRGVDTSNWTLEGFDAQIRALCIHLEEVMDAERQAEKEAIQRFEDRVANLMHTGADRERVIAWLMNTEGASGDFEYFAYTQGLPYCYFSQPRI